MIIKGHIVNQYIVKEDDDKASEVRPENHIHCRLEEGRSITQSKGRDLEFVMSMMRAKHYLNYVLRMHSNLMIALQQIQLREPAGSIQFI